MEYGRADRAGQGGEHGPAQLAKLVGNCTEEEEDQRYMVLHMRKPIESCHMAARPWYIQLEARPPTEQWTGSSPNPLPQPPVR